MKTARIIPHLALSLVVAAAFAGLPAMMSGCDSDEASSHSKTSTKRTVEGPEGKTTTTTTHEKKTDVYPK